MTERTPAIVFLWAAGVLAGMILASGLGWSQVHEPKFEVGIHAAVVRLKEHPDTDVGVGVRFGRQLNRHFGVEGEVNFFPRELTRIPELCSPDQRICVKAPTVPIFSSGRLQGQFGVKGGMRLRHLGLYGKLRPGFFYLRNRLEVVCIAAPCPPLTSGMTHFSLDFGGVVEIYPRNRLVVRFDIGSIYIRGRGTDLTPFARPLGHNLQCNVGLGFRF